MKYNKLTKTLAVLLPSLFLAACSSTNSSNDAAAVEAANGQVINGAVTTTIGEEGYLVDKEKLAQIKAANKTVFFEFDNSNISAEYAKVLAEHAKFLRKNTKIAVVVEGHTDERGTPEYNIALGERRAMAVAQYLQSLGVQGSQLSIMSYGEEKPLVMGSSAAEYARNRRAVIVYQ